MDDQQTRFLAEMGPRWHLDVVGNGEQVFTFYEPYHQAESAKYPAVHHAPVTITYGADERQQVDLYMPVDPDGQKPAVVMFVHGGAFIRGERNRSPWVFRNICLDLCRQGLVVANAGYRLAPAADYPIGAQDVADAALATIAALQQHGLESERFFLMGHSAGGTHCATALFDPVMQPKYAGLRNHVSGLIMVSPRLAADQDPRNPNVAAVAAYFGADASTYAARSPLTHLKTALHQPKERWPRIFLAMAEYENPLLQDYADQIKIYTDYHFYPVHNHMSIIAQMGTADSPLGAAIGRFCKAALD